MKRTDIPAISITQCKYRDAFAFVSVTNGENGTTLCHSIDAGSDALMTAPSIAPSIVQVSASAFGSVDSMHMQMDRLGPCNAQRPISMETFNNRDIFKYESFVLQKDHIY